MSDEYQSVPVAVARAAVQASGELEGIEGPLYMGDAEGAQWLPYFSKVLYGADGHPEFAKVIITRKGQKPREVVIAWDEYAEQMDADPEWDALRASKPMSIFGAEVERHAYRVVFADVLAPLLAPTRIIAGVEPPRSWEPRNDRLMVVPEAGPVVRDWSAEVKAADAAKLNALYDEAREAGALAKIPALQLAFTDRMLELSAVPKPRPVEKPRPQGNRRRGKRPGPKP